jgi:hypothetical protein
METKKKRYAASVRGDALPAKKNREMHAINLMRNGYSQ